MKIKVLTHVKGFIEAEIPDEFEFLRVTLMTGDEIIEVYCRDPFWGDAYLHETLDPERDNRSRDFFDCSYIVLRDQLDAWNNRQPRYHIYQENEFEGIFGAWYTGY